MSEALLAALQHGDSFFPSGAVSFSWGLETLAADGAVRDAADVAGFITGQLRHRWASCDRPALLRAYRAGDDLDAVAALDRELEALALARELREGSRRSGRALLGVHSRLGTPNAAGYRDRVLAGDSPGHAPAVQGLVWHGAGLTADAAAAVSLHAFSAGLLGAALRLGLVNHIEVQHIIAALRPSAAALLAEPEPARLMAFSPAADIAMMRHEVQDSRLFAN
ncbi:MAG: urease accessory protein UreF [Alphaproteobacteria bacterium]|nr:urease accessory protein UreF [Alphaproteobacteria bacterium]